LAARKDGPELTAERNPIIDCPDIFKCASPDYSGLAARNGQYIGCDLRSRADPASPG
jgi:hypothetical protein